MFRPDFLSVSIQDIRTVCSRLGYWSPDMYLLMTVFLSCTFILIINYIKLKTGNFLSIILDKMPRSFSRSQSRSRSRSGRSRSRSRTRTRSRSRSPSCPRDVDPKNWRSLFIGYLPNHATMDDVESFFKGYGDIESISLKPGYGKR